MSGTSEVMTARRRISVKYSRDGFWSTREFGPGTVTVAGTFIIVQADGVRVVYPMTNMQQVEVE